MEKKAKKEKEQRLREKLSAEENCWHESQPDVGKNVKVKCVLGNEPNALVMPYFAQVPPGRSLTDDEETEAVQDAVRNFAEKGWKHKDPKWNLSQKCRWPRFTYSERSY